MSNLTNTKEKLVYLKNILSANSAEVSLDGYTANFTCAAIDVRNDGKDESVLLNSPEIQGSLSFTNTNVENHGFFSKDGQYQVIIRKI